MLHDYIGKLLAYQNLSEDEAHEAMEIIMTGQATEAQIGGYLIALRMKGETANEIAGSARAMRDQANAVTVKGNGTLLDTAGTGGDGLHTFNISTTAAFVIAGAGRQVAKHGNRAASSRSGSADVLASLGVNLDLTPEQVGRCIDEIGIGFLFAPKFHPAMKHVGPARKELGQRTIFNILGPLTNPAGATHQIIGVYDPALTHVLAEVLGSLGSEAALVLHGYGGLDELTTGGPNRVSHLRDGKVNTFDLDAFDPCLPFQRCDVPDLRGGDPAQNARILRDILCGEDRGPRRDVVLLNAAAALAVECCDLGADPCGVLRDTVARATESLDSGAALARLEALIARTQSLAAEAVRVNRLDEIFEHKRLEVAARKSVVPPEEVRNAAAERAPALDLVAALRAARHRPALIAEVKAASPSRGDLASPDGRSFDPVALARVYAENGAAAVSVLTDEAFFRGSLDHLRAVRAALPAVPLLRKDFVCDPYQVYEARAAGADAVLLIVACLALPELRDLAALARSLGMAALVEVHSERELAIATDAGASLVGINNRDLRDFTVRIGTAARLCQSIPPEVTVVGESGIFTANDVGLLSHGRGVDAVLVGEALVTAADVAAQVRELSGAAFGGHPGHAQARSMSE